MALEPCLNVVYLLKNATSGHLNSKGFRCNVFLMTLKEQATTSLKTNSLNINHVEYKQDLKLSLHKRFVTKSDWITAAGCWDSFYCRYWNYYSLTWASRSHSLHFTQIKFVRKKKKKLDKRRSSSYAGTLSVLSLVIPLASIKRRRMYQYQKPSSYTLVWTFLFVYISKIVYGLLTHWFLFQYLP